MNSNLDNHIKAVRYIQASIGNSLTGEDIDFFRTGLNGFRSHRVATDVLEKMGIMRVAYGNVAGYHVIPNTSKVKEDTINFYQYWLDCQESDNCHSDIWKRLFEGKELSGNEIAKLNKSNENLTDILNSALSENYSHKLTACDLPTEDLFFIASGIAVLTNTRTNTEINSDPNYSDLRQQLENCLISFNVYVAPPRPAIVRDSTEYPEMRVPRLVQ